jgi:hypothetical protein
LQLDVKARNRRHLNLDARLNGVAESGPPKP